jgi:hypothetical protein
MSLTGLMSANGLVESILDPKGFSRRSNPMAIPQARQAGGACTFVFLTSNDSRRHARFCPNYSS